MLVPNQEIKTTWMPANREHYINLGYVYTQIRKPLIVKAEDLPKGSHMKVKVVCDYCGNVFEKDYVNYLSEHQDISGKDCCKNCQPKKFAEIFEIKHGVKNPFQLEACKQKSKETCIKKYGVENSAQSDEVKDKIKNTNIKKYGASCTLQSDEIKLKAQKTIMEKYGVKTALMSPEIQEKIRKTQQERYGEGNIAHTPKIAEKIRATNMERYGVPYTTQSPEVIAKMRQSFYKNGTVPSSKPEKAMCVLLHELYGEENCYDGYALDRLNMDCLVNIDGILIDFEYDGQYWHKDRKNYDNRRNYYLINRGYKIIRIKANKKDEIPSKQQIKETVDYLVKGNHSLTYIDMNI